MSLADVRNTSRLTKSWMVGIGAIGLTGHISFNIYFADNSQSFKKTVDAARVLGHIFRNRMAIGKHHLALPNTSKHRHSPFLEIWNSWTWILDISYHWKQTPNFNIGFSVQIHSTKPLLNHTIGVCNIRILEDDNLQRNPLRVFHGSIWFGFCFVDNSKFFISIWWT